MMLHWQAAYMPHACTPIYTHVQNEQLLYALYAMYTQWQACYLSQAQLRSRWHAGRDSIVVNSCSRTTNQLMKFKCRNCHDVMWNSNFVISAVLN